MLKILNLNIFNKKQITTRKFSISKIIDYSMKTNLLKKKKRSSDTRIQNISVPNLKFKVQIQCLF